MKRLFSETSAAVPGGFKFEFQETELESEEVLPSRVSLDSLFSQEALQTAEKLSEGFPAVVAVSEHSGWGSKFQVRPGQVFQVDYARSSSLEIFLSHLVGSIPLDSVKRRRCAEKDDGGGDAKENGLKRQALGISAPKGVLRPLDTPSQALWHKAEHPDWIFPAPGPMIGLFDSVWGEAAVGIPLAIEPGLASFAWPLTPEKFRAEFFQKRVYLNQGAGSRLEALKEDFQDFDIRALLDHSSHCVAWMKTISDPPVMQYIDCSPDIAMNCYLSGHALYFNPSLDVQRKYLIPLMMDLGLTCSPSSLHSDVEIFAAPRPGVTPWHFDSQHNFTIQLTGSKKWSVCPGPHNPVINFHPRSSNAEELKKNRIIHALYDPEVPGMDAKVPPRGADQATEYLLRPGSVMYIPAGMWHRVESVSSEPALSINFSLHPPSWTEIVMERLTTRLLQNPKLRSLPSSLPNRVSQAASDSTPQEVLDSLSELIAELRERPDLPQIFAPANELFDLVQVETPHFHLDDPVLGKVDIPALVEQKGSETVSQRLSLNPVQHIALLDSSDCAECSPEEGFVVVCHDGLSLSDNNTPMYRACIHVLLDREEEEEKEAEEELRALRTLLQQLSLSGQASLSGPRQERNRNSRKTQTQVFQEILNRKRFGPQVVNLFVYVGYVICSQEER